VHLVGFYYKNIAVHHSYLQSLTITICSTTTQSYFLTQWIERPGPQKLRR